ncbi:MAG: hypothetical protein L3J37_00415 [Rhodobacteraceae bacterium]|nr:hypothetical protein [Paracoccaceae bacterium]
MNIKRTTLASSLLLALALQAVSIQPVAAGDSRFQEVTSYENFLDTFIGKTITSRYYSLTLNADYTLDGYFRGQRMRGKWLFVSNEELCFDMATSIHCVTPRVKAGDATAVRFNRPVASRNPLYLRNPYPNLWGVYVVTG